MTQTVKQTIKTCKNCDGGFVTSHLHPKQVFCGKDCKQLWWESRKSAKTFSPYLTTGTRGAMSELLVAIDLFKKGFEVFRALSPATSCDLIARKNSKEFSVEVRTGRKNIGGKLQKQSNNVRAKYLAVYVTEENKIYYLPDFTEAEGQGSLYETLDRKR